MVLARWMPHWGIAPWRPFRDIEDWGRHFEDFFGRPMMKPNSENAWMPVVDVFERDDKFIVKAELPGMKEKDIEVSVVGDALNIRGEKETETEVKEEDYYRCERSYGSFYRSIPLPSTVNTEKIEANIEDGVLEVTLSKFAGVKTKKVPVSSKKKAIKAAK